MKPLPSAVENERTFCGNQRRLCDPQAYGKLEAVRIVHDPFDAEGFFKDDPSHSEIVGLPRKEEDEDYALMIGYMIAECIIEMHPAISELGNGASCVDH